MIICFLKKRFTKLIPLFAIALFATISLVPLITKIIDESINALCFLSNSEKNTCNTFAVPDIQLPHLTPWASIGGCGAGGSGGGSGDGIKWIGNHVGGGLIDVETMMKFSGGENFSNYGTTVRISGKPFQNITAGISLPLINLKSGEVQYQTNQEPNDRKTGGFGDLSFDVGKSFGSIGQYSFTVSLSIPTGQYDIARGSEKTKRLLPASLQMGSGLYNAGFTFSGNRDFENGIFIYDLSFSYPFNLSASGKNRFLDKYFGAYADRKDNQRFYYNFKGYGENDLGAFTPPSISVGAFYGYKGVSKLMHSWGAVFSAPLGVAWIHSEKVGVYDPKPDPDHKAWNAALVYGIESTNLRYPIFLAVSKSLHDKTNKGSDDPYDPSPMEKWDGPDWKDFLHQWTIATGIKVSLF